MHIFADQISKMSLSNMNLRIELSQKAAENETVDVGTLIIPVGQANNFVNALASGLKQMEAQIKAKTEQRQNNRQS